MKKSDESAGKAELRTLEFPDWSGMDESPARISPEAAWRLCEQYRDWFPEAAAKWHSQRPEKCLVEFKL